MTDSRFKKANFSRNVCISEMSTLKDLAVQAKTDKSVRTHFRIRFGEIDVLREDFNKQHQNIVSTLLSDDSADLPAEEIIRAQFQNDFFKVKTIFSELFDATETGFHVSSRSSFLIPGASASNPNIRLPEIKIGKFDGDFKKFPTFLDLFDALIHNNQSLSEIEKFNYLISSLDGQPLSLVRTLPMIRDNYKTAYESLVKRYSNKRLQAQAHWDALESVSKVNANNAEALRNLLDTFNENLAALKHLKFPVDEWDFILLQMMFKRLDHSLVTKFEIEYGSDEVPRYESLTEFLRKYCSAIETLKSSPSLDKNKNSILQKSSGSNRRINSHFSSTNENIRSQNCSLCRGAHLIFACPSFLKKTPKERHMFCRSSRLCFNCLSSIHTLRDCKSINTCRECKQRHHTLLHLGTFSGSSNNFVTNEISLEKEVDSKAIVSATGILKKPTGILLATALVEVCDNRGYFHSMRALIDSGSMMTFISKRASNILGLPKNRMDVKIQGLNSMETDSHSGYVTLSMRPVNNSAPLLVTDAIILEKISDDLPRCEIIAENFQHLSNIKFADPRFYKPGKIDLLLGADVFTKIIRGDVISGDVNGLDAIQSIFGYIIMGKINTSENITSSFFTSTQEQSLNVSLQRLWELENVPSGFEDACNEDDICESIYKSTQQRNSEGRYIVSLPFCKGLPTFPGSRDLAISRFLNLERRLTKQPQLHNLYREFLREYLEEKHMVEVDGTNVPAHSYYLPHHGVLKGEGSNKKIRVVFNASSRCPGSTQSSLNDHLFTGKKLQQDIVSILLRFRLHNYVLCADIKQMYRMILMDPKHCNYQRIIWRFSPDEDIQDFELRTVTYGISSAPFLALRTLQQLVKDEGADFPLAVRALQEDTYVDDIVSGCSTVEETKTLRSQLETLMRKGGFELRKFSSNHLPILSDLPSTHLSLNEKCFESIDEDASLRILGMQWHPSLDAFHFQVRIFNRMCTKRHLLSELARIYDPIGFLGPVTFFLKNLIQRIWATGIGWDDEPPADIIRLWERYKSEISHLSSIKIPRQVMLGSSETIYELHGFCDASEKGYCALAYIRIIADGKISPQFLCSKTKVAPLRRVTIPRLELCAAVLMAKLLSYLLKTLKNRVSFSKVCAWSDSQITLCWIKGQPNKWPVFVANRVAMIQNTIPLAKWLYVETKQNPADAGSRGLLPGEFCKSSLWFSGPPVLCSTSEFQNFAPSPDEEQMFSEETTDEPFSFLATEPPFDEIYNLIQNYSSLSKIIRILCFVLRFKHNIQSPKALRKFGWLTSQELNHSLLSLVKTTQRIYFSREFSSKKFPKPLRRLNPFLDSFGILRVGGRLRHSDLNYEAKHPMILPCKSLLTSKIIEFHHKKYLHAGQRTLIFLLAQRFWILSAKRAIFSCISKCTRCFRSNPHTFQPPMADLPKFRVSQLKAFSHVGVDYAGPYAISMNRHRGTRTTKAYICLFVCCSTKAIHLELASDLSSDIFLAALQRFIARRGRCHHIYSDCGTNFVGAFREIKNFLRDAASCESIEWHFNPPSAPHMGGLWEAGVKSVKSHLKRVLGEQILSYEEFSTLLCMIEAILNSRPLNSVSSDSDDVNVLTPGHFLTLEPLCGLPVPDMTDLSMNRLNRWQLIQRMHQHFWNRWSKEYLHTLQQRSKWLSHQETPKIDSVVLIKDDKNPPGSWSMGRIIQLHPGPDTVARVATVKTNKAGTREGGVSPKFPVIVFIHGESYEWNSGNPYDGSVLASYGQLVVITINYRLGILGFLNANTDPYSRSPANYGLMDQIAALHWIQENVASFGGDPTNVTVAGHGTGAACVNFLLTSSAVPEGVLFHRAILMSGSALSPWALIQEPSRYAAQVAIHANCSPELPHPNLLKCLREKPLETLLSTPVTAPEFSFAFGPSVDGVVIDTGEPPGESSHHSEFDMSQPEKVEPQNAINILNSVLLRKTVVSKLSRYDLLLGVVKAEAYFAFNGEDVQYGIEADRRSKILRNFVRNTYSYHLSEILATIVNEYTDWERPVQHPINIRDETLEALSDAQYVAPVVHTADLHSAEHRNSYLYVFDYQTKYGDYPQRQGCIHGEELAYLFGAPLVGGMVHFGRNYTKSEVVLSETTMIYWSNFVRTGNPNESPDSDQTHSTRQERARFKSVEWTAYEAVHKKYLNLDTKPKLKNHYRAHRLSFWLNLVPDLHKPGGDDVPMSHHQLLDEPPLPRLPNLNPRKLPTTLNPLDGRTTPAVGSNTTVVHITATTDTVERVEELGGMSTTQHPIEDGFAAYSTALSVTIAVGCSLLLLNILIFVGVYYQRDKARDHMMGQPKKRNENGQMPNNICGDLESSIIGVKADPATILAHHHSHHHQLPPPEFADLPHNNATLPRPPPPPKVSKANVNTLCSNQMAENQPLLSTNTIQLINTGTLTKKNTQLNSKTDTRMEELRV